MTRVRGWQITGDVPVRRDVSSWVIALVLGVYGCAFALAPSTSSKLLLTLPLLLILVSWWTIARPNRWLLAFIGAAWLVPPIPVDLGLGNPHIALLFAAMGALGGMLTFFGWQTQVDRLTGALVALFIALLVSCIPAYLYSGFEVAAASMARVFLFGISVYTFFFVRDGPFEHDAASVSTLLRIVFWAAVGSAILACVDFYFQFPTATKHSDQYVWLASRVFRRAQGVFYESSTLGNLSVFTLLMIGALWLKPGVTLLPKWALFSGPVPIVFALIMSYSRASLVSLAVGTACLLTINRRRRQWKRIAVIAAPTLVAAGAVAFAVAPGLTRVAWLRMAATAEYFWINPDAILSGRLTNWSTLANFIQEEPWRIIFGLGYKTLVHSGVSGAPLIADNTYLSTLIETGVFGLTALLALNYTILARCYRAAQSTTALRSLLGAWIFSFWAGETVQMLSGDLLTYWRVLPVFFCVVALADREIL